MNRLFLIIGLFLLLTHPIHTVPFEQANISNEKSEFQQSDGKSPLIFSFEPGKVFICPSTDERESIMINLELYNTAPFKITIKQFFIRFLKGEKVLVEKQQGDSFFRHRLIKRKRKIASDSSIKWSGVCLTAESFGSIDKVELLFHLKGRRRYKTIQVLDIPVTRYLQKTKLRLPFQGFWKVTQGHTCRTNHRLSGYGGDFAWDFANIGNKGRMTRLEYSQTKANKYVYGFGKEILAPAGGKVVKVVDHIPDNEAGQGYPRKSIIYEVENPLWAFGNYIIIDHKNGEFSLLAHLKKGSIVVGEGEEVQIGQIVARCGNSGNSNFPHIHYQLMDSEYPIRYEVNGLPALFSNYKIIQYPTEFPESLEEEKALIKLVDVINGDPAKNHIVYASD